MLWRSHSNVAMGGMIFLPFSLGSPLSSTTGYKTPDLHYLSQECALLEYSTTFTVTD